MAYIFFFFFKHLCREPGTGILLKKKKRRGEEMNGGQKDKSEKGTIL